MDPNLLSPLVVDDDESGSQTSEAVIIHVAGRPVMGSRASSGSGGRPRHRKLIASQSPMLVPSPPVEPRMRQDFRQTLLSTRSTTSRDTWGTVPRMEELTGSKTNDPDFDLDLAGVEGVMAVPEEGADDDSDSSSDSSGPGASSRSFRVIPANSSQRAMPGSGRDIRTDSIQRLRRVQQADRHSTASLEIADSPGPSEVDLDLREGKLVAGDAGKGGAGAEGGEGGDKGGYGSDSSDSDSDSDSGSSRESPFRYDHAQGLHHNPLGEGVGIGEIDLDDDDYSKPQPVTKAQVTLNKCREKLDVYEFRLEKARRKARLRVLPEVYLQSPYHKARVAMADARCFHKLLASFNNQEAGSFAALVGKLKRAVVGLSPVIAEASDYLQEQNALADENGLGPEYDALLKLLELHSGIEMGKRMLLRIKVIRRSIHLDSGSLGSSLNHANTALIRAQVQQDLVDSSPAAVASVGPRYEKAMKDALRQVQRCQDVFATALEHYAVADRASIYNSSSEDDLQALQSAPSEHPQAAAHHRRMPRQHSSSEIRRASSLPSMKTSSPRGASGVDSPRSGVDTSEQLPRIHSMPTSPSSSKGKNKKKRSRLKEMLSSFSSGGGGEKKQSSGRRRRRRGSGKKKQKQRSDSKGGGMMSVMRNLLRGGKSKEESGGRRGSRGMKKEGSFKLYDDQGRVKISKMGSRVKKSRSDSTKTLPLLIDPYATSSSPRRAAIIASPINLDKSGYGSDGSGIPSLPSVTTPRDNSPSTHRKQSYGSLHSVHSRRRSVTPPPNYKSRSGR